MFTLKQRTWDGIEPRSNDYEVLVDGKAVGRIHKLISQKERWDWAIYDWGSDLEPTLEEAKEKWGAQWEQLKA